MDEKERLELLKIDIMAAGSSIYDQLLTRLLITAEEAIRREGAALDLENYEHNQYIIGYAAWLFKQRENPEMKMPRWLRYGLNNLIISQKAREVLE